MDSGGVDSIVRPSAALTARMNCCSIGERRDRNHISLSALHTATMTGLRDSAFSSRIATSLRTPVSPEGSCLAVVIGGGGGLNGDPTSGRTSTKCVCPFSVIEVCPHSWALHRDCLEECEDVIKICCDFVRRVAHCCGFSRHLVLGVLGIFFFV